MSSISSSQRIQEPNQKTISMNWKLSCLFNQQFNIKINQNEYVFNWLLNSTNIQTYIQRLVLVTQSLCRFLQRSGQLQILLIPFYVSSILGVGPKWTKEIHISVKGDSRSLSDVIGMVGTLIVLPFICQTNCKNRYSCM